MGLALGEPSSQTGQRISWKLDLGTQTHSKSNGLNFALEVFEFFIGNLSRQSYFIGLPIFETFSVFQRLLRLCRASKSIDVP